MTTTKVRYNQIKTGLPAGGDVSYNDVSLLLNMEGSNGSTTFTDSSSSGHSITANGNASISTSEFKFGSSSAYFDGNSYLNTASNDFAFGTGDFTIEWWQNFNADSLKTGIGYEKGALQISTSVGGFNTSYNSGILIAYGFSVTGDNSIAVNLDSSTIGSAANVLSPNTWQHLSVSRNSGTVKVFLNGSEVASAVNTGNVVGQNLVLGGYYNTSYLVTGYMDNIRITKGVARYTSNFSVPTAAFPAFESKEGKELRVGANGTIELES